MLRVGATVVCSRAAVQQNLVSVINSRTRYDCKSSMGQEKGWWQQLNSCRGRYTGDLLVLPNVRQTSNLSLCDTSVSLRAQGIL